MYIARKHVPLTRTDKNANAARALSLNGTNYYPTNVLKKPSKRHNSVKHESLGRKITSCTSNRHVNDYLYHVLYQSHTNVEFVRSTNLWGIQMYIYTALFVINHLQLTM